MTDKILIDRETLERVLKAVDWYFDDGAHPHFVVSPPIEALREALSDAEQPVPQGEHVAVLTVKVRGSTTTIDLERNDAMHCLPEGEYDLYAHGITAPKGEQQT